MTVSQVDFLMEEWDFERNNTEGLDPNILSAQSSKKAYWKGKCGHSWKARICNRYFGRKCPVCSNKIVVQGINDLKTTHPNLSKEWHPSKNGNLLPSNFSYGSSAKIWWVCPKGHEYQATINKRTSSNGTSCPICNSQKQTSFSEQAFYFYIKKLYPNAISRYKCKELGRFEIDIFIPSLNFAIEYDGEAWHKTNSIEREKRKFQICKKLGIILFRLREGKKPDYWSEICDDCFCVNDLYKHKFLNKAIIYLLNYIESIYIKKIKVNESYVNPLPSHFVDVNRDRYEILEYVVSSVKNSIIDVRPDILEEWHPTKNKHIKPEFVPAGSDIKYWWRCNVCGHEYEMTPAHKKEGCGCPICSRKKQFVTLRNNKVLKNGSIKNPLLLKERDYTKNRDKKPEMYTRASEESVWWICSKCGHEWKARISNREHGRGCPCCSHAVCVPGKNDLATEFPSLVSERDYSKNGVLKPFNIVSGSNRKVWWICPKCGHSYQAPVCRRTLQGSGCRKCADKNNPEIARKTLIKKRGSFGDNYPELLKEFSSKNTVDPYKITKGSREKVLWCCSKCGHEWYAILSSRTKGHGCPECARRNAFVKVLNIDTGIEYESIISASKMTGIDPKAISSNCRGRTKHAGGYRWKYLS